MPDVSLIIPTYNRADLIGEAIDSVLSQSGVNLELIVVDDGSTDETGQCVHKYSDNRLRYIFQDNAGAPSARNHGFSRSISDYVLFLDSDDRLLPDALQTLLAKARADDESGVIGGDYEYIDHQGRKIGEANLWKHGDHLSLNNWLLSCPFIPSATLIKRTWLIKVGGFDEGQAAAQDWDLWLQLAAAGCPMKWCKRLVCQYRLHRGGLSKDFERHRLASIRALDKVYASSDLPVEVLRLRPEAYCNIYINSAARKYGAGQISGAQQDLLAAAQLLPEWVNSGQLIERLIRAGQGHEILQSDDDIANTVLNSLPEILNKEAYIRRALSRLAAASLFSDYHNGDWSRLGALWWQAALHDPRWLKNRGFWSIGMRHFLGLRKSN